MVELYVFSLLNQSYYFTNANEAILFDEHTYQPLGIQRDEFTKDWTADKIKITASTKYMPFNLIANNFGNYNMGLQLIPYSIDYGYTSARLENYKIDYEKQTISLFFNISDTIGENKVGLRTFSSLCTHTFGDENCHYDTSSASSIYTITQINPNRDELTVSPAVPQIYRTFSGITDSNEVLSIINYNASGDVITLTTPLIANALHLVLKKYCNKTKENCIMFQGHTQNFGGFTHIPIKNPVVGISNPVITGGWYSAK